MLFLTKKIEVAIDDPYLLYCRTISPQALLQGTRG